MHTHFNLHNYNNIKWQDKKILKSFCIKDLDLHIPRRAVIFAGKPSYKNMETKRPATDKALVSLIMGSTSDYPIMEAAAKFLNEQEVPFEILAFSAHRTPMEVIEFAQKAEERGVRVIIAAAGMAAHLPGVIAALTPLPVIGVPIKSSIEGIDAAFAILQMPPGIPVATVAINGALNAAILALQILSVGTDETAVFYRQKVMAHKKSLKEKIKKANEDLKTKDFTYRVK